MGYFGNVVNRLSGKFVPTSGEALERNKTDPVFTLYSAMCAELNMESAFSALAYRNYEALVSAISLAYRRMSEILGRRADVWGWEPIRTEDEINDLLRKADARWPTQPVPKAIIRPGTKKILGRGKPRGVIASESAAIAFMCSTDFSTSISKVIVPGMSDMEFIVALDALTGDVDETLIDWTLAKKFTECAGLWFRNPESMRVSAFCQLLFTDWAEITDVQLDLRIGQIKDEIKNKK